MQCKIGLVTSLLLLFSEEIGRSKFNSMIGLTDLDRVDAELYDDFETVKAREVCVLLI